MKKGLPAFLFPTILASKVVTHPEPDLLLFNFQDLLLNVK